jgi:hypothetical protein
MGMEESKLYMDLLKNVEKNKYKLIQELIAKAEKESKTNPAYVPFYAEDCFVKVSNEMLEEAKNKK